MSLVERVAALGGYAVDLTFSEGMAAGEVLRGSEFDGCLLSDASWVGALVVGSVFSECRFERCDLSMVDLLDTRFVGCTFVGCKLLGLNWTRVAGGLVLDPCAFEECRLDDAIFTGCDVTGVRFNGSRLRGADFAEAVLRRADFGGCELAGARFVRADLREASLVGATGWVLDPRENQVQGLRVDYAGSAGLLAPIGVIVE